MTKVKDATEDVESDDLKVPSAWQQMKAFIDANVPEGDFIVAEWADKIRAKAAEELPLALATFEADLARQQIALYLSDHLRFQRNASQTAIRRSQTEEKILAAVASGKVSFYQKDIAVKGNEHKQIGALSKLDTAYLRDFHRTKGNYHILEAKFWQEVEKRHKDNKILSEVLPEADVVSLYRSITAS